MSPISWLVEFFRGAHPVELLALGIAVFWALSLMFG